MSAISVVDIFRGSVSIKYMYIDQSFKDNSTALFILKQFTGNRKVKLDSLPAIEKVAVF